MKRSNLLNENKLCYPETEFSSILWQRPATDAHPSPLKQSKTQTPPTPGQTIRSRCVDRPLFNVISALTPDRFERPERFPAPSRKKNNLKCTMWCFPNRKTHCRDLQRSLLEDFWITARSDASLFSNMWMPIRKKRTLTFHNRWWNKNFFFAGSTSLLSVTQKEAWLPNAPTFGSWTAAIHGDSMCLRTCVYPPSANTLRSGTSPVAVCALVLPRGTVAWPVFMFVSFSCPWNRRPSSSPEETQAKQSQTRRLKGLLRKHHTEMWK